MSAFSYTVAPYLRVELEEIEKTKQKILLAQLSPQEKTRLVWDSLISSIYFSIRLANLQVRKVSIANFLSPKEHTTLNPEEKLIFSHKKTFDMIYIDWSISQEHITPEVILHVASIFGVSKTKIDAKILSTLLDFIQVNPEHPIIQAALAHILIVRSFPYSPDIERLARLTAYLFLYKYGYDFQRLICLEQYYFHHMAAYSESLEKNLTGENLSPFLEFYIIAFRQHSDEVLTKLTQKAFDLSYPDEFFQLTERQKQILALFEQPGVKISNKMVQEIFKVSQITASRDLARINTLGLIFSHGRGRSVYYTKP